MLYLYFIKFVVWLYTSLNLRYVSLAYSLPISSFILVANFLLVALRDIKEDFLVKIFDVAGSGYSSWIFAQLDSIVTLIILIIFGLMVFVRNNMRVLLILLSLVILGMLTMSFISLRYEALQLSPVVWLFIQSLCLYLAYLCFQTIFFDRFIGAMYLPLRCSDF